MHYVAILTFPRDSKTTQELLLRRRHYTYPAGFNNAQSYVDVQGGRAVVHFETDTAESIQRYTADWPELIFEIFPVISAEKGWEVFVDKSTR